MNCCRMCSLQLQLASYIVAIPPRPVSVPKKLRFYEACSNYGDDDVWYPWQPNCLTNGVEHIIVIACCLGNYGYEKP